MRGHFAIACLAYALSICCVYGQNLMQLPSNGYNMINFLEQDANGDYRSFVIRGNATRSSDFCYQVTEERSTQNGRVWWPDRISLDQNFRMDFVIFAGDRDSNGADGYAFVLHNDSRGLSALGRTGQYVGVGGGNGDTYIEPSIAIEIDTFRNSRNSFSEDEGCDRSSILTDIGARYVDPEYDHLSLVINGANGCPADISDSE